MVRRLRVTLPSQMFNLASSQCIFDCFPHMQELIMKLDGDALLGNMDQHPSFPLNKLLSSRGVASCILDRYAIMFNSPTPVTADLFERGREGHEEDQETILIHQDFPNVLKLANNADIPKVHLMTKFLGCVGVEEELTKLEAFRIKREAGDNEEVLEEEVAAASQLLDLLADSNRRGCLRLVELPKVDFTYWLTNSPFSLRLCCFAALAGWTGWMRMLESSGKTGLALSLLSTIIPIPHTPSLPQILAQILMPTFSMTLSEDGTRGKGGGNYYVLLDVCSISIVIISINIILKLVEWCVCVCRQLIK